MTYKIIKCISADYCEAFYRFAMRLHLLVSTCQRASCAARIHSLILHTRVIVLYDTLLTFPREVECIWKRKWSAASALFLLNRYNAVVLSTLIVFGETTLPFVRPFIYDSSQSIDSCRGLQIFITFPFLIFKTHHIVANRCI